MRQLSTGLVLSTLAALALAGCGDKTATVTEPSGGPAYEDANVDSVIRKAGLWEQTTNAEGMGSATANVCLGSNPAPCAGATLTKAADGYSVSATCKTPATGTMAIEGVAKGDLSSAYTLTTKTTISGAPTAELNRTVNSVVNLRYLGPCPEGMSVGQIQTTEGAVIDMSNFDPAKARDMARQAQGQ